MHTATYNALPRLTDDPTLASMRPSSSKSSAPRVADPLSVEDIAEHIWQLPTRRRETLEDLLEEKFVRTVLRRSREVSRLRKTGKLLTLRQLKQSFARR